MKKYYEDAGYNAAFERCIEVMTKLILKYGPQVLKKLNQEAPQAAEAYEDDMDETSFYDDET